MMGVFTYGPIKLKYTLASFDGFADLMQFSHPRQGEMALVVDSGETYVYTDYNGWNLISAIPQETAKPKWRITVCSCPCCGAPVDRHREKCSYCGVPYPLDKGA